MNHQTEATTTTDLDDRWAQAAFEEALARVPAAPRRRTATARRRVLGRALPVALLLLVAAVLPWVNAVNAAAASSNLSCADFAMKVRVWATSLERTPGRQQLGTVDGVPVTVRWTEDGTGARVEASRAFLVQAGCAAAPSTAPARTVTNAPSPVPGGADRTGAPAAECRAWRPTASPSATPDSTGHTARLWLVARC